VAAVLAAPFALINKDFSMLGMGTDETLHTLLRFCALMGLSLLFLQIVTGGLRPILRRLFRPAAVQSFHGAVGVAGLAFIVCHLVLLIPSIGEHWAGLSHGFFVLGPIALAVLLTTIGTALVVRRTHPLLFSRLHVLNYLVFIVAVAHATAIGTQGSTPGGRALLYVYLLVALSALAYRASSPAWRHRLVSVRTDGGRSSR
jgi:hypothetical protein